MLESLREDAAAGLPTIPGLASTIRKFCSGWNFPLVSVNGHGHCHVGPDRTIQRLTHQQTLRAAADGPDRLMVLTMTDKGNRAPHITPLRNCAVGRTQPFGARRRLTELLLDGALSRGETVMVEYEVVCDPPRVESAMTHFHQNPVPQQVTEVHFDPALRPARCWEFVAPAGGVVRTRPLTLDADTVAVSLTRDCPRGATGVRWEW